ncbi:Retrograde regulation protein 2 [Escovopsis weberi]|uniref:Retrograde regulation protein 2 n=1 Tax=Escovopsis weberi TaxID=150374 RepID=A0A0M8N7P8_ESCWE|nr:Retrograde regulation protein 2 [Escovopsis weberi]
MDDIENLIFISDDDYADLQAEEDAGGQVIAELPIRKDRASAAVDIPAPAPAPAPQPGQCQCQCQCQCKPRLPWQGRGDKLIGVVDMGSNGIRFSISDLSDPLARILPTVLDYRSSISLYDAQFDPESGEQIPIPDDVTASVCAVLNRFIIIARDLGLTDRAGIHVIATEATRSALNSAQFRAAVRAGTGLEVELLPRDVEGQVGALGIASGFRSVEGLTMDLGGGSTQLSWMVSQGGHVRISPRGSFSFPYGAAALTRTLRDIRRDKGKGKEGDEAVERLRRDMVRRFRDAFDALQVPETMADEARRKGGFRMYLSGGGFRGWGYLLLFLEQTRGRHYPLSIINGYAVGRERFEDTRTVREVAEAARDVFRVSDRRRAQVPAVAFLVSVMAQAIPHGIREAHFCQGGVREGFLFRQLPPQVRAQSPLEVATRGFAPESAAALRALLGFAIPGPSRTRSRRFPEDFGPHVLDAFTNVLYTLTFMSKETASTTALYSTGVGLMSSAHGVSHQDRARLALMLEARYRGELPPREAEFREALRALLPPEEVWWTGYLGRVGYIITILYPAGRIEADKPRVVFSSKWGWNLGKRKNKEGLVLTISIQKKEDDPGKLKEGLQERVKKIEKFGKKKNWIGKDEPWGMKVKVHVVEEEIL